MSRLKVSTLTDTLTIHAGDTHLAIAPGQTVDLDQACGAGTLEDALGPHAGAFVDPPVAEAVRPSPTRKRADAPAEPVQE